MSKDKKVKASVDHAIEYDGQKYVSGQSVTCMTCGKVLRLTTNNYSHRLPEEVTRKRFQQKGWVFRNGHWYCPEHTHKDRKPEPVLRVSKMPTPLVPQQIIEFTKEPAVATAPTPIRSLADIGEASADRIMTTEHRRKINREIGGNWDEAKGRYLGEMTDQKIATSLNVPRAWVESVRVDNYGDNGGNDEIEELKAALDVSISNWTAQLASATQLVDKAVNAVGTMETMLADLKAMRKRLERVEVAVLPRRS